MSERDTNQISNTRGLTWAGLIARWTDFARAAVVLPKDPEGAAWRASVAPAIGLQAVTLALTEVDRLPADERAHGLDLASVLIRRHAREIHDAWGAAPMPEKLTELIDDARRAHAAAAAMGAEFTVTAERLVMPTVEAWVRRLVADGFSGDLLAAPPGTVLYHGEPAIFARPDAPDPGVEPLTRAAALALPRQVYRQIDPDSGRPTRDVVAPMPFALRPGRPLLRLIIDAGERVRAPAAQDPADGPATLPVVFEGEAAG